MNLFLILGILSFGLSGKAVNPCRADQCTGKLQATERQDAGGNDTLFRRDNPSGEMAARGCAGQEGARQPDPALSVVQQFYVEYITEWTRKGTPDPEKTAAIRKHYLTRGLFDKLEYLYREMELDYDPFLEAQDCDRSVLDRLRIERDTVRTDLYRVYLWDGFNRKYQEVKLLLKPGEQGYRIDDILSLPDD